jgi:TonB family protein
MIRLLLLSLLASTAASVVVVQSPDSPPDPTSLSIACPVENGPPSTTPHKWVAVSTGLMARNRTGGKDPKYPSEAKRAHIEGRVVLVATISASGNVEDLCVSQGPEMLRQAAFNAVRTWKYKPFEVNGQQVEVKTQMNVDFALAK